MPRRLPRHPDVSPAEHLRQRVKRHLAARMLAALWRSRRSPTALVRARLAERSDHRGGRVPAPRPRRRDVKSVVWFPVGPGRFEALCDSIEALRASDGDDSQILVIDDCSTDSRERPVRERFPEVQVLRTPFPSGGPPNMWRNTRLALDHALAHYDFELWTKMDSDAIVVAPQFSRRTTEAMSAVDGGGIGGSYRVRCDGVAEDHVYHAHVLARETPRDRVLAAAARMAAAKGWRVGDVVQTGVCSLTREACDAITAAGWTNWHRPWHSQASEDLALTLFVEASGLAPVSLADPADGVFAVALQHLPLSKEQLADGRWVAAHSTQHGLNGETEADVRRFLRARRAAWSDWRDRS